MEISKRSLRERTVRKGCPERRAGPGSWANKRCEEAPAAEGGNWIDSRSASWKEKRRTESESSKRARGTSGKQDEPSGRARKRGGLATLSRTTSECDHQLRS